MEGDKKEGWDGEREKEKGENGEGRNERGDCDTIQIVTTQTTQLWYQW